MAVGVGWIFGGGEAGVGDEGTQGRRIDIEQGRKMRTPSTSAKADIPLRPSMPLPWAMRMRMVSA